EPRNGRPVGEQRPVRRAPELVSCEERDAPERRGRVEDAAARVEKLRIALTRLDQPTSGRERGSRVANERREVLCADAKLAVEGSSQVGVETRVQEQAGPGENDG